MDIGLGQFGDHRLAQAGAFVLDRLVTVGQSGIRIRPLGGDRAGEIRITRFLRNPRVTPTEMIATASARTAGLVTGRHVLLPQDTTGLRDDGDRNSLQLHAMIAVDALDGALLGLVHGEFLRRVGGKKAQRKNRPFAEKESRRWLDAVRAAEPLVAAGAACVTAVGDAEKDIYEVFACRPPSVELLVRACQDRVLADGTRLFTCTDGLPELGRVQIDLPAAPGRSARTAELTLKAREVSIPRPRRRVPGEAAKLPPHVVLRLVEAREVNAPEGVEPAHWRLLTTHQVGTMADAKRITGFYRERWTIEQLFRVKKTKGFNIEAVRIADVEPFETLAAATLLAAVQVLQLVRDRDGTAGRPLEDVFDPADQPALEAVCATLEGKTDRQKNPHAKASLAYATWVCARLGGWTGYYGKPGPIVVLNGFLRFKAMLHGWKLGRVV
jgi:hypothetical protein